MEIKQSKFRKTPHGNTTMTEENDAFITANYLITPIKTMARTIGRKYCLSVRTRMRQLGLVVPPELAEQRRKDSCFVKGHEPDNKGRKNADYYTPEALERSKQTWFKKGHKPVNTCEKDGEIRTRHNHKDRNGRPYKWIRISVGNWRMLHVVNWEKVNGEVPAGHVLIFRDGDSMNTEVENLELITLQENMLRNSIQNYPEDIKEIMQLKGKITQQINRHLKPKK